MSISNSFSASTTISSTDVNANFTDIGSELTNSVARDGQTSITAQIKFFSGTEGTPGIGWASDTDSGFYRIGGDNVGLSLGGTKYFDFSTTGLAITGALTLSTALAVAQGGTGATTAAAAATALGLGTGDSPQFTAVNIGHATQNTLTGSGGNLSVEGNLLYRAGGTDVPVTDGGTGASSASDARTNLGVPYASAANMESVAASVVVTPDVQHRHPGHPKAWASITTSGGTPTLQTDYGVSSVDDDGVGAYGFNFDTAFSSANYAVGAWGQSGTATVNALVSASSSRGLSTSAADLNVVDSQDSSAEDVPRATVIFCGDH